MQLDFTSSDIADLLNVQCEQAHHFSKVIIDSRKVSVPEETLFIAFKGIEHDGHQFIASLYENGVRGFVVHDQFETKNFPGASFFTTKDPVDTLHKIAIAHRKKFSLPVIGVTGSYGKTIVKEWLYELLNKDYVICRSPKSYNSQIGVALSVLELTVNHTLAIFEMGISHPGEMKKLVSICQPDYGVLTNIGTAHLENFDSQLDLTHEKLELLNATKGCVLSSEISFSHSNAITFGNKGDVNWKSSHHKIEISIGSEKFTLQPFDGAIPDNIACCVSVLKLLNKIPKDYTEKFNSLSGLALRLEKIKGKNGNTIYLDAYNNDLIGLHTVLQYMETEKNSTNLLVLSDLENSSISAYKEAAEIINRFNITHFIGIGSSIDIIFKHLNSTIDFTYFETIDQVDFKPFSDATIILKGSRKFHFEKLIPGLEFKRHDAAIYIDVPNLRKNLHDIQKSIKPTTKLMVMLKAEAYGSGIEDIGQFFDQQKIDYFGVAYAQEGVSLRSSNIKTPVMVMNVSHNDFDILLDHNLEPTINSYESLDEFIKRCLYRGISNYPIHLNLETGMNRLGLDEDEILQCINLIEAQPEVKIQSVYSHLACSDQKNNSFNQVQFDRFSNWVKLIEEHYSIPFDRHILNSSGIYNFPEQQYDMVRAGISLYGLGNRYLHSVLSFAGRISKIKKLSNGDTVGYGQSFKADKETIIATIPIGYADGLPRALGNLVWSFKDEVHEYPIVGNVCMDMCMIDISSNPDLQVGDEVYLFRDNDDVRAIAQILNTIPYEIITHFSDRIRRVLVE